MSKIEIIIGGGDDTLLISFAIPIRMELLGSNPTHINELSASFKYKKHSCSVVFQGLPI